MKAKLVLSHAGVILQSFPLDKESLIIGRRDNCDVVLDDPVVSSQHSRVFRIPSEYLDDHYDYYIEDLGSTNGTQVNGDKIHQPTQLKNGDNIKIGRHRMIFDGGEGIGHEETAILLPDDE